MKASLQEWRGILAVRDARLVLVAGTVALAGDAMAMIALLLRVHASGAGPYAVTALLACFALPVVLTMGFAGQVADRVDSRRVLVVTGLAQALAVLGLAAWSGLGETFALVVVMRTAFAFGNPVWTTLLPHIVGESQVGRLISLQQGLRAVAGPAGAGLGGVFVQVHRDSVVFLLSAVTMIGLTAAAVALRTRRRPQALRLRGVGSLRSAVLPADGWRALRVHPRVHLVVLALLPFVITLESVNVVEVFLVRDVLGASPAQYGLVEVVSGAAAVIGSLVAGSILAERSRTRAILAMLGVCAGAQVGQGLAPTLVVFLLWCAAVGFGLALGNALLFALIVTTVGDGQRGVVLALVNGLSRACSTLALALGGVLASSVGPRAAYLIVGTAGLVLAGGAAVAMRRVAQREGSAGDVADPAGVDLPAAGEAHQLEHPAVVGDEQHGAIEGIDGGLQLLDGGQVEVIGGLIQDEEIDPTRLEQREGGPGSLTSGE